MSITSEPKDSPVDFVASHIKEYLDTGGATGHEWNGTTILLLTTLGRRSGTARRTALIYREDGGEYVVVASKAGADTHPAWYLNLLDHPEVRVRIKDEEFAGRARVVEDAADRARLWDLMAEVWPDYNNYATKTEREIPIVAIERI